jgi:hypothetical protein
MKQRLSCLAEFKFKNEFILVDICLSLSEVDSLNDLLKGLTVKKTNKQKIRYALTFSLTENNLVTLNRNGIIEFPAIKIIFKNNNLIIKMKLKRQINELVKQKDYKMFLYEVNNHRYSFTFVGEIPNILVSHKQVHTRKNANEAAKKITKDMMSSKSPNSNIIKKKQKSANVKTYYDPKIKRSKLDVKEMIARENSASHRIIGSATGLPGKDVQEKKKEFKGKKVIKKEYRPYIRFVSGGLVRPR